MGFLDSAQLKTALKSFINQASHAIQTGKQLDLLEYSGILNTDGSEDRQPQEIGREDELSKSASLAPSDVAQRVFGSDPEGAAVSESREKVTQRQRENILKLGLLPKLPFPSSYDARGTEHTVCFRGEVVVKFQHKDGWIPILDDQNQLGVAPATPSQYLRRLDLQNTLFGDDARIIGLTRANRLVSSQPTLRGVEPTENEIRDVMNEGGWLRVPMETQNLPHQLMGSA